MLRLIREMAVENPWVLRIIMGIIALAFVVTMGWYGFSAPSANRAALVNGVTITIPEYRRAYRQALEFYRRTYGERFNDQVLADLDLENRVINDLIERVLWLQEARRMGLRVTDDELRAAILGIQAFHREGRFDPQQYRRVLRAMRTTPAEFEASLREDLLVQKVQQLIRDAVLVTPVEVQVALPKGEARDQDPQEAQRIRQFLRLQKADQALRAYAAQLKQQAKIQIYWERL